MGAMVQIKHSSELGSAPIANLAQAIMQIVQDVIGSRDVFTYVEPYQTTVNTEAIEIFVQLNKQKTEDPDLILSRIAEQVTSWKQASDFGYNLNLNVVPVEWHYKI